MVSVTHSPPRKTLVWNAAIANPGTTLEAQAVIPVATNPKTLSAFSSAPKESVGGQRDAYVEPDGRARWVSTAGALRSKQEDTTKLLDAATGV
jgi:hypothetical protein